MNDDWKTRPITSDAFTLDENGKRVHTKVTHQPGSPEHDAIVKAMENDEDDD